MNINEVKEINLAGIPVNINKQRYLNFLQKGTVCQNCGLKGKYFVLEKQDKDTKRGVLTLYGNKEVKNLCGVVEDKEIIISSVTNKRVGKFPIDTILCSDCQHILVSHNKSNIK